MSIDPASLASVDEKWEKVRAYYEEAYKMRFREKPKPILILELHRKMEKLSAELLHHQELQRIKADCKKP